jgi:hypothetical protein
MLRPIEQRDGRLARAAAADGDDWRTVKAARPAPEQKGEPRPEGHIYHLPPEVAHLAADGMPWNQLELILEHALGERQRKEALKRQTLVEVQGKEEPPSGVRKRWGKKTIPSSTALAIYIHNCGLDSDWSAATLAAEVVKHAHAIKLPGAGLLDESRDGILHALCADLLDHWMYTASKEP